MHKAARTKEDPGWRAHERRWRTRTRRHCRVGAGIGRPDHEPPALAPDGDPGDPAHQLRGAQTVAPLETRRAQGARARSRKAKPREWWPMNARAAFGLSALLSLLSSAVVAVLFVWPLLRATNREQALIWLVAPHMFLRFIGIGFLVPG